MNYSQRLNAPIKMRLDTGKYKIKCFTCNYIISSYNHEPTAKKLKYRNTKATHRGHDIRVVE